MSIQLPAQNKVNKIKLIAFDLDGTLLNHNKEISKKTEEFLISLQKQGYTLALASGRFEYELTPYIKQLKIDHYGGIAISANGLEVHDFNDQTLQSFTKLSKQESLKLIEAAKQDGITCYLNYNQTYYTSLCTLHKIPVYCAKTILYPFKNILKNNHLIQSLYKIKFDKHFHNEINELHKICFLSSPNKLKRFESKINSWNCPYVFYFVNPRSTEITHNSVGKYEAIQYVCHKRNLSLDNVMAFGDSGNDLNLIKHAGIGVAMKNAFPEVKAITPYQTFKNNQSEGVYDYLKQLYANAST